MGFGKWSFDDIEIRDISLVDYIAVKGDHATYLPHTAGRYQKKRFRKASCPIVERLACCLMRKGRNSGKKLMAVRIVQHTLEIIHLLTDQNPVQVVVDAIINSGPREDSTRVGGAGVVRRQAVDMSRSAGSTTPSTSWRRARGRPASETSRRWRSAWRRSWSTRREGAATPTPSRRRTRLSACPSLTVK